MSRTWTVRSLALTALLALPAADAAAVYRCHTAHGLSYQDVPCRGRDYTKNLVDVGEPSVIRNTRTSALAEWADQTDQENRKLELQARAQRLQREERADQAEFAVMEEQIDRQKDAVGQGVADMPSIGQLQLEQYQAQREYADRAQRRNAELQDLQSQLNQQR
jgi:hypothetical protein